MAVTGTDGDGVGVGAAVGAWVGEAVGPGVGAGDGDGAAVGAGVAEGVGVGVAVGDGDGDASSSSPASVAWIRYPVEPVPELSRWPSGPVTLATIPASMLEPAAASVPMIARTGPDPSSIVMPSPSLSSSGAPEIVPVTRIRIPSSGSPAAPVTTGGAAGKPAAGPIPIDASATRSVRCAYRLSSDPSTTIVVPAGHEPATGASR